MIKQANKYNDEFTVFTEFLLSSELKLLKI